MTDSAEDFSPNMGFPYLLPSQAQKHVTVNENLRALDALVMAAAETRALSTPPASPVNGAAYIPGVSASGDWATHESELAVWQDEVWAFHTPLEGWRIWIKDEGALVVFAGGDWAALSGGAGELQNLPLLGIGTAADASNPLSVKVNNGLFTAKETGEGGTGDLRLVFNKESEAGILSLLFQQGYGAKAELGLIGDNKLALKVYASDGTEVSALLIDNQSGVIDAASGLTIKGREVVEVETGTRILTVPGEFPDIQTAIDSLANVMFAGAGKARIEIAAGTYALAAPLTCAHVQASRISVIGPIVGAVTESMLNGDPNTDEATLRAHYGVVLDCVGSAIALGGLVIESILFTNTSGNAMGIVSGGPVSKGTLKTCAMFGFNFVVYLGNGDQLIASETLICHAAGRGVFLWNKANLTLTSCVIAYAASFGIEAEASSISMVDSQITGNGNYGVYVRWCDYGFTRVALGQNTGRGLFATAARGTLVDCDWAGNSSYALQLSAGYARVDSVSVDVADSATARRFHATNGAVMEVIGTHSGGPVFSPAEGASGNNEAVTI